MCCDRKRKSFDLYRPLGRGDARPLTVVTWGNGTFASPDKYDFFLRHLASWGILVIGTQDQSTGDGRTISDAIDVLLRDQRKLGLVIDPDRIAAVGHSQGDTGVVNALMASGGAIRTAVSVELPGQQLCRGGDCDEIPIAMPARTSIFCLSGTRDGISPARQSGPTTPPFESNKAYYHAVPAGRIKARAAIVDADHNDTRQPEMPIFGIRLPQRCRSRDRPLHHAALDRFRPLDPRRATYRSGTKPITGWLPASDLAIVMP